MKQKKWTTQEMVITGMLAAVAGVLMSLEFSIPVAFPVFYKIDFSDIPSIIALFAVGPSSAVCVEITKILIKLFTVGTNSMYVGELANLLGIVLYIAPIHLVYSKLGKTKKAGLIALITSIPVRIAFSCFTNACITLPLYAKAMGISLDAVVMSVSENSGIKDLTSFIVLATIPFNFIKIGLNYLLGYPLFVGLRELRVIGKSKENTRKAA